MSFVRVSQTEVSSDYTIRKAADVKEDQLIVNSAEFIWDNLSDIDNISGENLDKVKFKKYPTPYQKFQVKIDFFVLEEIKGNLSIRIYLENEEIHQDEPFGVEFYVSGKSEYRVKHIWDIVFPSPGEYRFEIVLNGSPLKQPPISLTLT